MNLLRKKIDLMEFKEFENPEQKDYDIKAGSKNTTTTNPLTTFDNSLNSDSGIDLNALGDMLEFTTSTTNSNTNYEINEFGEIIRPEGKGNSR